MTRRCTPRERFRVYSEEEFFARGQQIAQAMTSADSAGSPSFPARSAGGAGARGLRMALGTGLVAGVGALGLIVVFQMLSPAAHLRRKAVLRAARANAWTAAAALPLKSVRAGRQARPRTGRQQARRNRAATTAARVPATKAATAPSQGKASRRSPGAAASPERERPPRSAARAVASEPSAAAGGSPVADVRDRPDAVAATIDSASRPREGEFGFER